MASTYEHTVYLNVGSGEFPIEITYTVTPSFAGDRIDPPYPAEAHISKCEVIIDTWRWGKKTTERKPVEGWLLFHIENDPDIHADLLSEAGEEDIARADEAAEMRREDARMWAAE